MGHLLKITLLLHPHFFPNVSCFNVHVKQKQIENKMLQAIVIKVAITTPMI